MEKFEIGKIIVTVVIATVLGLHLFSKRFSNIINRVLERRQLVSIIKQQSTNDEENSISVSSLYVHPVKSLRAVSVQAAKLSRLGLENDRKLMLVRPSASTSMYRFITQRQCASLATIIVSLPKVKDCSTTIDIKHANSNEKVSVDITPSSLRQNPNKFMAGVWDDKVQVVDLGDEAAKFFQKVLSTSEEGDDTFDDVRLVAQAPTDERQVDGKYCPAAAMSVLGKVPNVSLTDGFPILIASEQSLAELNRRLEQKGKDPIPMSRFRPNIVVKSLDLKAFDEDEWKAIQIGGNDGPILHVVKGCPRCKQSCTDQLNGTRYEEPLETLSEFRALGKNAEDVYFAQNVLLQPDCVGKEIKVGDSVRILTRGKPVWDMDAVQAE